MAIQSSDGSPAASRTTPDSRPLSPDRRAGVPVTLKGVAFAGERGVSRVEVSTDDGRTWQEARRDYPGTRLTWALWSYAWRPANLGQYKLAVRATDGMGAVQPSEERGLAPEGATGYHRVTARVVA